MIDPDVSEVFTLNLEIVAIIDKLGSFHNIVISDSYSNVASVVLYET